MEVILKKLIAEFIDSPQDVKATRAIAELRLKDTDFCDELFDSFSTEGKSEIYLGLLLWTGPQNARRILERRVRIETDELCKELVETLLEAAREW